MEYEINLLRLIHALETIYHNKCLGYMEENFIRVNEHHPYYNRDNRDIILQNQNKTGRKYHIFVYNSIEDWNILPVGIKKS